MVGKFSFGRFSKLEFEIQKDPMTSQTKEKFDRYNPGLRWIQDVSH